jgi:CheY-like chemotaxis protein
LARVIARALERLHTVEVQGSAESALRILEHRRFDAIVSAYRLGQGGTARKLMKKARSGWPRPRTILYLTEADARAQVRSLADHVLPADAGFDELLHSLT